MSIGNIYNPNLVSVLLDAANSPVEAVTRERLTAFEAPDAGLPNEGAKFYDALELAIQKGFGAKALQQYVLTAYNQAKRQDVLAIRPDRATILHGALAAARKTKAKGPEPRVRIRGVGERTISLFGRFCEELIIPSTEVVTAIAATRT